MHYNKEGESISVLEWLRLMNDFDYRRIALDECEGVKVSTVWLGVDHSFPEGGPLLMFETMVFLEVGNYDEEYCERYCTEKEALAGHEKAKRWVLHRAARLAVSNTHHNRPELAEVITLPTFEAKTCH